MKKVLGLLMLTIVFTCCDLGVRPSSAGNMLTNDFHTNLRNVHEHKINKDGIEYYIYYQYDGGLHVVNHTKELLEVELLRLQIDSLKK
jgi:hypothetical protein